MEVHPVCTKVQEKSSTPYYRSKGCPAPRPGAKCRSYYIQPPRVQSFAPKRSFCPPEVTLDTTTTYHTSYLNNKSDKYSRLAPIRPSENLHTSNERFHDGTTSRMSYKPVWEVVKAKPVVPLPRRNMFEGPMQTTTTVKQDFCEKYIDKAQLIIPCGNIRTSRARFDGETTSGFSYLAPGPVDQIQSFKPINKYCEPEQKLSNETTTKLSYPPVQVLPREFHPWAQKPKYTRSNVAMDACTTYSNSFLTESNVPMREKPIVPVGNKNLIQGDDAIFRGNTHYSEIFVPHRNERVAPIIPCKNIALSDQKMAHHTTSQLSYQVVNCEKRNPIRPKERSILSAEGPIPSNTTNRDDFGPKITDKPSAIVPCDNIHNSKAPLEASTTSQFSYMNPGRVTPLESFKPLARYNIPTSKLDTDTVNKLSFKTWNLEPKASLPWAQKVKYQTPTSRMQGESTYLNSFPPPGEFIEECDAPESCTPAPDLQQ
ncbi:protein FAM154B-like [Fopius arisanus]|uniref:Protein FAM154B-like n=1 Tax=Fopius arisanus TaxID=64838 RepID=A0A9R1T597_9HYME|nr:PREDICTED: protein FAM154B-like [Fopius arisanus]